MVAAALPSALLQRLPVLYYHFMTRPRRLLDCCLLLPLACLGGCTSSVDSTDESAAEAVASSPVSDSDFVLGDLIEPFDPPPLEELLASKEWIDSPVVDSLERLIERQANEPRLATPEEALALRNDSPEANAKIKDALGRVAVAKDGAFYDDEAGIDWDAGITLHAYQDIGSSNPILYSSVTEGQVNDLTAVGLFSFDWNLRPFASSDTVASWQTSSDFLVDRVVMRDDLTWSDGTPITAHDIVFTFQCIMTSAVPVPAVRSGTDQLRWIEAYDDHTLVFFHKRALATNVWNLNFPIIPKHIYEDSISDDPQLSRSAYHVKYEDAPVMGGPYKISRRARGQEIVLSRRKAWYMHNGRQVRDKPFFKTIRFKVIPDFSVALLAVKKGDLEQLELDPMQWTTETNSSRFYRKNTKVTAERWLTWSFQWNLATAYFSDQRVRKAMGLAFNHEELLEVIRYGLDMPAIGTFHPGSPWSPDPPPEPYRQNLDRSRELMAEAGWVDSDRDRILDKEIDGRRVPFEFTMTCRNQQWRIDVCNLLRENLQRIGVVCNVRPLESTVAASKLLRHDFQAHFGGWSTGADPDTSVNIFGTGEGRNFGNYSSAEVDRLYDEAKREFDFEERRKLYAAIHMELWKDQPYTWLFHQNAYAAFSKELRGYTFSPRGPFSFGPGLSSVYKPSAL